MTTNKIIYVSCDNSGDFNCDCTQDEVNINEAILHAFDNKIGVVHIKAGTYIIRNPIELKSNIILQGDGQNKTIIKLADSIALDKKSKFYLPENMRQPAKGSETNMIPLMWAAGSTASKGIALKNVTIKDIQIDANATGNSEVRSGRGYFNCIYMVLSDNILVTNCYLLDGLGDGLRAVSCTNSTFSYNKVYKLGHDAAFFLRSDNCHSFNNSVAIRTNSGTRMNDCTNSTIHDNDFWAHADFWDAGNPGIQIERQYKDAISVKIYNNKIHDTYGCGIWCVLNGKAVAESGKSEIKIYNNEFYGCGLNPSIYYVGGVVVYGLHNVKITNNVFDKCYGHGIVAMGINDASTSSAKVAITIKNNIITNTLKRKYCPNGTGYGIQNRLGTNHKITVSNNCVYDNIAGNYKNVTAKDDINVDPMYIDAEKHNYRLKALSCCVNMGVIYDEQVIQQPIEQPDVPPGETPIVVPVVPVKPIVTKTVTIYPIYNFRLKENMPDAVLKFDTFIDVGAIDVNGYRGIISFNLDEYTNATIEKATLSLYWYYPSLMRINNTTVGIFRPAKYDPGSTWNNKKDWYDRNNELQGSAPYSSVPFNRNALPTNSYYTFDVTELVQKYVNFTYNNTGFLIKSINESNNYLAFYSGNIAATNKKAKLTIIYR